MTPRSRVLALVPAYNEAASLPALVGGLRRQRAGMDILVVNDGSTDETPAVIRTLDVRWLEWRERRGVGPGISAGLRYRGDTGTTSWFASTATASTM